MFNSLLRGLLDFDLQHFHNSVYKVNHVLGYIACSKIKKIYI